LGYFHKLIEKAALWRGLFVIIILKIQDGAFSRVILSN